MGLNSMKPWKLLQNTGRKSNNLLLINTLKSMNRIAVLFILCFIIIMSSCTLNKAKINENLKKYFEEKSVSGSFALLNNQSGDITIYNMSLDTQRVSPGTSFKIINTLVGLETGVITDEAMLVKGENISNKDSLQTKAMDLKEAFKNSGNHYFREIAGRIGKDTLQIWIDSLQYGNKNTGADITSAWSDNTLRITPDEQLGLMFKLYFDKLPFSKYAQQIVKNLMLIENNDKFKYSYATGTGFDDKQNKTGWVIGWVEENMHVFFFSTFINSADKSLDMEKTGADITQSILKELGFFKGEK